MVWRSDCIVHCFQNDCFKSSKLWLDVLNAYAKSGRGVPAHVGEHRGLHGIAALFTIGYVLVNPALHKFNRPVTHHVIL